MTLAKAHMANVVDSVRRSTWFRFWHKSLGKSTTYHWYCTVL